MTLLRRLERVATNNYALGAYAGAAAILFLNALNPENSLWSEIKSTGNIIAGLFAFFAGRFVWKAKEAEIEIERNKVEKFQTNFRVRFSAELVSVVTQANNLIRIFSVDRKVKIISNVGCLEHLRIFTSDDRYITWLDSESLIKLQFLEFRLALINSALDTIKKGFEQNPESMVLTTDFQDIRKLLPIVIDDAHNLSEEINPSILQYFTDEYTKLDSLEHEDLND